MPPINGNKTLKMVDITHKSISLREAIAEARVIVSKKSTIEAIQQGTVPKGDVFEVSRAAGLLGVKKTPDLLPDCHPLPIEYAHVEYQIEELEIIIKLSVKTIYKTGVEVEAMHGASIVALNMYDMLKPLDKGVEIKGIKLLSKTGGKSSLKTAPADLNAAVVVCSDSVFNGQKEDVAGKKVIDFLEKQSVSTINNTVVPDEVQNIQAAAHQALAQQVSLLIFVGGTGLSPRDVTPEALKPLIERPIAGLEETMRAYGQDRTPYAMLSRSLAGTIGNTLVLALPGSTKGATECLQAIFPAVLHLFHILKGGGHPS